MKYVLFDEGNYQKWLGLQICPTKNKALNTVH